MNKVELVHDRLKQLKGVLLLDKDGMIYLLKGHKIEEKLVKPWWPFGKEVSTQYVSQIELSTGIVDLYEPTQFQQALLRLNHIINDRKRYLRMLSCLSNLKYTIKRK